MKIALFSDIHANLPALQAVLADIDSRNPDLEIEVEYQTETIGKYDLSFADNAFQLQAK